MRRAKSIHPPLHLGIVFCHDASLSTPGTTCRQQRCNEDSSTTSESDVDDDLETGPQRPTRTLRGKDCTFRLLKLAGTMNSTTNSRCIKVRDRTRFSRTYLPRQNSVRGVLPQYVSRRLRASCRASRRPLSPPTNSYDDSRWLIAMTVVAWRGVIIRISS